VDLVTKNLLEAFKANNGYPENIDESELFEHFVNYCMISKEYSEDFLTEDIRSGGRDDMQIDGIGIIVNGVLCNSKEEVEDLVGANKYLEAEFVFIQSKTSSNFNGSEISNMFFGLRDLFADRGSLPRNEQLAHKESIIKYIYKNSSFFKRGNPKIKIYYATLGKWTGDDKLLGRINTEIQNLEDLNIFEPPIYFEAVDARRLQQYYNRAQNVLTCEIEFVDRVTLPKIPNVQEAYLGFLPAKKYLELITDEDGKLIRSIFNDNVRDFQGDNSVNEEIKETINGEHSDGFVLFNNGVTIVSDELNLTGNTFKLTGYQIVNGCQTSHVLYNNLQNITPKIQIPVKLIVSPDDAVKNLIIKATNRQTMVKDEELAALTDFQKALEQYHTSVPEQYRLYYERRSRQYRSRSDIEKIRIVTIPTQIRSFASMFLNKPHQASRYYGTLLKDIESRIFLGGHPLIAYYVSAYALFLLEGYLRRGTLDNRYRPFKYHLLGIFRMLAAGAEMANMKTNKFERYCEDIQKVLWGNNKCLPAFKKACRVLDSLLGADFGRDRAKDSGLQKKAKISLTQRRTQRGPR